MHKVYLVVGFIGFRQVGAMCYFRRLADDTDEILGEEDH